jgi:uncharacterized protein
MLWFFCQSNRFTATESKKSAAAPSRFFDSSGRRPYYAPAMANPLLARVSPADLANRSQVFDYKAKIDDFPRLVEIVVADLQDLATASAVADWRCASVAITLRFERGGAGGDAPVLLGDAATCVGAVCQRCLEPFMLPVTTELRFRMLEVHEEFAENGDDEFWQIEDGTVCLRDIVEESLVMALPLAPRHRPGEPCVSFGEVACDNATDVVRPFAKLRAKMDKSD